MNDMIAGPKPSRRAFVVTGVAAAGALMVGIRLVNDGTSKAVPADAATRLNAFVRVDPDDSISITYACSEMGQGTSTALPMIIADEMEADWEKVSFAPAPVADVFRNPRFDKQGTWGSGTIRGWYMELRKLGAATRQMLIQAAAETWRVPASECAARDSFVTHLPTQRTLSYGQIAARAATLTPPKNPRLKDESEFKLIGHPTKLWDTPLKVNGTAQYGSDVILPGTLYAAVKTSPVFGGKVDSFDDSRARAMPGYHSTVAVPHGIAVVGESYWQAKRALDTVELKFSGGTTVGLNSARLDTEFRAALSEDGIIARNDGDLDRQLESAATVVDATYDVPYLAHATMEPMNCTAHVANGRCTIWAPTQFPELNRNQAAEILGIGRDKVEVHTTFMGGGFGRRAYPDFVEQVIHIARAIDRPVKLIWSREEDMRHDFYRPIGVARLRGGLDAEGRLIAFEAKVVGPSLRAFWGRAMLPSGVDDASVNTLYDHPYAVDATRISWVRKEPGVPIGSWRSVGHSTNLFFRESFIDEMAHAAGRDAFEFRRAMLGNSPRDLKVLEVAARESGWGKTLPPGHGIGISVVENAGTWVSQVAEVSVEGNRVKVHKVTCAVDCGMAVNPLAVEAQMQGGIVFGLTAALRGEITFAEGAVMQGNFHDYPMLMMDEMPEIDVHIVNGDSANPGGVGEPGTSPIAPAVTNAIFNVTGQRIRSLPISKTRFDVT